MNVAGIPDPWPPLLIAEPLTIAPFCWVTVSAQGFAQDNLQNSAFRFFGEVSRLRNVWLECAQSWHTLLISMLSLGLAVPFYQSLLLSTGRGGTA